MPKRKRLVEDQSDETVSSLVRKRQYDEDLKNTDQTFLLNMLPEEILVLILSNLDNKTLCTVLLVSTHLGAMADEVFKHRLQETSQTKNLVCTASFFGYKTAYFTNRKNAINDTVNKVIALVFQTIYIEEQLGVHGSIFQTDFHDSTQLNVNIEEPSNEYIFGEKVLNSYAEACEYCEIHAFKDELEVQFQKKSYSLPYTYGAFLSILNDFDPLVILEWVLKEIENPLTINEETNQGLLHYFIGTLRYDVIKRLLELNLDPNAENRFEESPIMIMFDVCTFQANKEIDWPSIELLQLLLNHKASFLDYPNIKTIQIVNPGPLSESCLRVMAFLNAKKLLDESEDEFKEMLTEENLANYLVIREQIPPESSEDCDKSLSSGLF